LTLRCLLTTGRRESTEDASFHSKMGQGGDREVSRSGDGSTVKKRHVWGKKDGGHSHGGTKKKKRSRGGRGANN